MLLKESAVTNQTNAESNLPVDSETLSGNENFIGTPKFCAESCAHAVDMKCTLRVTADKRGILNIGQVECVPMQFQR